MKIEGTVLWYDVRDGRGILTDATGAEYYTSSDVLIDLNYLRSGDKVSFEVNPNIASTLCAHQVRLTSECGDPNPCESEDCQKCCSHDERDHGICMDCGDEEDPGEAIDRAMDYFEGDR